MTLRFAPIVCACLLASGLLACATSPLGRSQLRIFPDAQMAQMGVTAFDKMKDETPPSQDGRKNAYVSCIAQAITGALQGEWAGTRWEVVVFDEDVANAFALPGGKIGVYTGLLSVARNQDQLATVMGHEVAHVLAHHSNERVSNAYVAESGMKLAQVLAGEPSPMQQQLLGLLGLGAQYGVLLPYGRAQESEADLLGLDLMARAGFDPRESVALWRNMAEAGGQQPPEFLSTHPSHQNRIADLEARIPGAMKIREEAQRSGSRPACG